MLIISRRPLVAQVIKSLLESDPGISHVEITQDYEGAMRQARVCVHPPHAVVIDLPRESNYFVERPFTTYGREVITVVLQEDYNQTRLYVHAPGRIANLQNLLAAIHSHEQHGEAAQPPAPLMPGTRDVESLMASEPDVPQTFP